MQKKERILKITKFIAHSVYHNNYDDILGMFNIIPPKIVTAT